ncbi:MAG TPA: Rieske (2Fe-2S) protein [Actinoplanes sp.]|nr:Rieske (2Fe-2S) protein [Actinoplanes sp.]
MTDVRTTGATCRHERAGSATRRAVFGGAGALGAACLLAACGADDTGSSGNNEPGYTNNPLPAGSAGTDGSGSTAGSSTAGTVLAAVTDVPEGGGIIAGDYVVTQPSSGEFRAFSKVCTHQGCDVSKVDAGVIMCPCHGSEFSIQNGAPVNGPARQALPETKVKVDGDNVVTA